MSLIPTAIFNLSGWIGRCLDRVLGLSFTLDGVSLDDNEIADELHYGRS